MMRVTNLLFELFFSFLSFFCLINHQINVPCNITSLQWLVLLVFFSPQLNHCYVAISLMKTDQWNINEETWYLDCNLIPSIPGPCATPQQILRNWQKNSE